MEKSLLHPVKSGRNTRMMISKGQDDQTSMPNLIDIQVDSYIWFLKYGINEVFKDIFPIEDKTGNFRLDYVSFSSNKNETKYDREECKQRNATFSAPLKVRIRLEKKEEGEVLEDDIYMGELPIMTENGSFIINGAERVVVSQMVRSPGIYFDMIRDKTGKKLYSATLIPNRGAWIEYDCSAADVMSVRVDRTRKVPITVFLRALDKLDAENYYDADPYVRFSLNSDDDLIETFGEEKLILQSIDKEPPDERNHEAGIIELYRKIRPGEQHSVDSASGLLTSALYDPKRYDLGRAGRYKYNKKLHFRYRLNDQVLSRDVVDEDTGEVVARKGEKVNMELATKIQDTGVPYCYIKITTEDGNQVEQKMISNRMVDINQYVKGVKPEEWHDMGITENVYYPLLKQLMKDNKKKEDLIEAIKENALKLVPKHVMLEDILASVNYACHLEKGVGNIDDIDHLGNRRIRAVGELLQNQYRIGLSRLERVASDRMRALQPEDMTPKSLINNKPVTAAIKEFFGSSQLSQFMDQNNPLSELTHKRRLSALGPGGISRDRAGFEVRDVHYTHYGRVCPIETPEGPNIGLINSLATCARINEYGFIEAPYRKVDKTDPKNPVVTDEKVYMTADTEDAYKVAQASEPLDEEGHFKNENISGRYKEETSVFKKSEIDFMDVSPRMVFSVATNMIPFLQNDDPTRALMGSNMQRQAVPLMITECCRVGTGIEAKAASDSGVCVKAVEAGEVTYVDANKIIIKDVNGEMDEYRLLKFSRSNQSTSYNQRPLVEKGQKVKKNEIIADGASTSKGELALGKNPLIGFMTWEGYNYEDAVLISERLVKDDVYTSIHIEEYEAEARITKNGPERMTNDIHGRGQKGLKHLNSDGIIAIGTSVKADDILVGKVTPKGEEEETAEIKLLKAIYKDKTNDLRDNSLRLPNGAYGTVIATREFRKGVDEVPIGVEKKVCVYVAQKRKISVGDKMAGRHGNKGVVSRVLPVEDMPYLPNGRPLDIVLNPLGVPSRMNIGQILETHLSLAATMLGIDIASPTFDGATEKDITNLLETANDYVELKWEEFYEKYKDTLDKGVLDYLGSHLEHREEWKGVHIGKDGKVLLRDGRTGEYFDSPTTIGFMNYLKLHHLVDDKIHARSTGPYSLITQQPLGGKAQGGGQRFGEMEVWALEAYGAAYTLQEILTIKSDDIEGRHNTTLAILHGNNMPKPTIPESFKVLLKELEALCLDMTVLDEDGKEIPIKENLYDAREEMRRMYNNDNKHYANAEESRELLKEGFIEQEVQDGQFVNIEDNEGENYDD